MKKVLISIICLSILCGATTGCDFFEDKANIKSPEQAQKDLENAKKDTTESLNEIRESLTKTAKATWKSVEAQYKLDELEGRNIPEEEKTYEELYNIYSQKLKNECNSNAIEKCNSISLEGFKKIAQRHYCETGPSGDTFYSKYETWAKKIIDLEIDIISQ